MPAVHRALTEKEKETLRLMVRGHDAKSIARHFGLSVHTVNERLRDARRKLEVSSSREAARLLLDAEGGDPQNLADRRIGEAGPASGWQADGTTGTGKPRKRGSAGIIAGVIVMSILIGALALSLVAEAPSPSAGSNTQASGAATAAPAGQETPVVRLARDWLELGDEGRWRDGWLATSASFREANTVERWENAARQVRPPLGALVSRILLSQESVPAPPAGVEVVKFRSTFANRADVVETVSLAREGADWKVVGIYVD